MSLLPNVSLILLGFMDRIEIIAGGRGRRPRPDRWLWRRINNSYLLLCRLWHRNMPISGTHCRFPWIRDDFMHWRRDSYRRLFCRSLDHTRRNRLPLVDPCSFSWIGIQSRKFGGVIPYIFIPYGRRYRPAAVLLLGTRIQLPHLFYYFRSSIPVGGKIWWQIISMLTNPPMNDTSISAARSMWPVIMIDVPISQIRIAAQMFRRIKIPVRKIA